MFQLKIFLFFFICLITSSVIGQTKSKTYQLSGKVVDERGLSLPYVAVALFKSNDSSYVKGIATDMDGDFKVELEKGNYYAKLSFLSFENKIISPIIIDNKNLALKKISLIPSALSLDEFQVVEEKKLMEIDLDKRVFNVDKDITNQGKDATEILGNVPSVNVDIDGNVSLRGSENVRILINGKPSGLTGMSTAQALKQLQGNQIEKIEVITNPSSRYDAEGEVGIINIVLKNDKRDGINGSVNLDVGYPSNYGGGFNLNMKRKKMNVFLGYGINYRESPGTNRSLQKFTYPDTSFSYKSNSQTDRNTLNNNFRLGGSYDINDNNTLTVSGSFNVGDADNKMTLSYADFNQLDVATQTVNRLEIEDKDLSSHDISLNYRKTFKQKDRLFTFDAQRSEAKDFEKSIIEQTNSTVLSENLNQRVYNNEKSQNWLFQADYVHPIKQGKFETGLKSTLKKVTNPFAVGEYNDVTMRYEALPQFHNDMEYNENIYAAYMMFGNKIKKFSYQLGVRGELSDVETQLKITKELNRRNYFNLFPSTHFSYELTKENTLQLSYSKRINRPRHWWLLPFFSFTDSRNFFAGNPNLDPELTDAYEFGHLKYWKKGSLLSSVYYRHTTDVITRIIVSDLEGNTERKPFNLGTQDAFGIEFSGSYEAYKWWNLQGSFNFFREIQDGELNNQNFNSDTYAWSTRLNSKWTMKKKLNLQASFNYRAPQNSVQGDEKSIYSLDAGFSFDVLKGNGTVTFNASDIFNSRKRRFVSFGDNFVSDSEHQWRARYVRLSFTYRINQKKKPENFKNKNFEGGFEGE